MYIINLVQEQNIVFFYRVLNYYTRIKTIKNKNKYV